MPKDTPHTGPGNSESGGPAGSRSASEAGRDELAARIEETRQDLGETVEALAAKADVPSRVRDKAAEVRRQTTEKVGALTHTARQQVTRQVPKVRERAAVPAVHAVTDASRRVGRIVTRRPVVLYASAAACVLAGLWMWRRGRR